VTREEIIAKNGNPDKLDSRFKKVGEQYLERGASRYNRIDYQGAQVQKDLSNIQLQDAITGQHDRHAGNLKIGEGRARAYDNDRLMINTGEVSRIHAGGSASKAAAAAPGAWGVDKSRVQALRAVNRHADKNIGLPSHVDQKTASAMLQMKSSQMISGLTAGNSLPNVPQEHLDELKARYSATRRYVKAGVAAHKPEMISDPEKLKKWSSPQYQATVMSGAGRVPTIVGKQGWGKDTYNEQLREYKPASYRGKSWVAPDHGNYLSRSVHDYNDALQHPNEEKYSEPGEALPAPENFDLQGRKHAGILAHPERKEMTARRRQEASAAAAAPAPAQNPQVPPYLNVPQGSGDPNDLSHLGGMFNM
jgi:hypothetical protein